MKQLKITIDVDDRTAADDAYQAGQAAQLLLACRGLWRPDLDGSDDPDATFADDDTTMTCTLELAPGATR